MDKLKVKNIFLGEMMSKKGYNSNVLDLQE